MTIYNICHDMVYYLHTKKRGENMKKFLNAVIMFIVLAFITWIVASFIEVNMNNLSNGTLAWWNIFQLIAG